MAAIRTVHKVKMRHISVTIHHMKTNNGSTPRFSGMGVGVGGIIFVIQGQGHNMDQCHRSLSATSK